MTNELIKKYEQRKSEIKKRLDEFKQVKNKTDEEIFAELSFCLCTPQSKATVCWNAVTSLVKNNLLYNGNEEKVKPFLNAIRFNENKAKYIVGARKLFSNGYKLNIKNFINTFNNLNELRDWLAENVNGMGFKEASHFLRNIGLGNNFAILDVHILRNLQKYGVIDETPKNLSKKKYLEIENRMQKFAENIGIPLDELDLLLWSEETGFIFK